MSIKLRDYLAQTERTYTYHLKSIHPLDDHVMDVIERILVRYLPQEIGRITKSIYQTTALDFPYLPGGGAEVYFVDITLGLPISPTSIAMEITQALRIQEKFVIIRGDNDPTELENRRLAAEADIAEQAGKADLAPASLLADTDHTEADEFDAKALYGDEATGRLLDYLHRVKGEREAAAAAQVPPKPFAYLDVDPKDQEPGQPEDNFADDAGALQPASRRKAKGKGEANTGVSPKGNLDDSKKTYRRLYKDANGETRVLKGK